MMTPEALAQACSEAMHSQDHAAQSLTIKIIESTPGHVVVQMKVRPDMVNGHAICHGGILFTLCDTAFAHACNNTNKVTVASGCHIHFISPAHVDDVLTATAQELHRSRSGRTGLYDVVLHNQQNKLLAVFQGKSTQIQGTVIDEGGML